EHGLAMKPRSSSNNQWPLGRGSATLLAEKTVDSVPEALRHSLRRLVHRPGLTTAIVLILTLGIGVSTAIFSVVRRVLVRPIPVAELNRLVVAWEIDPSREGSLIDVSFPYFRDWRVQIRSFEGR